MAGKLYGNVMKAAFNKEVDFDSDTIKVALVSSAYTPNQDSHDYWDDVSANEVSGAGYTAGGQALTGKTVTYDSATNTTILDANDSVWAGSTVTARYAVVYDDSGATAGQKALIGYQDFGSDQSSTNGNFTVQWDSTGIVRITVA